MRKSWSSIPLIAAAFLALGAGHPKNPEGSTTASAPPVLRPPPVPDAVDIGDSPSPYEGTADEEALAGASGAIQITTMTRTITTFTMTADVSPLAAVDAATKDAIIQHVAADPRWRLMHFGGALLAFRRVHDETGWTGPTRGYHRDATGLWRAAIRFTPWKADSPWAKSALVGRASASQPAIKVTAYAFDAHPGWQATALAWSGPEVTLEIFEAGATEDLPHTAEMLGIVPGYVQGLAEFSADIVERGFSPSFMVAKEPAHGEPSVTVASPGPGLLEVRGHVHTSGPGIVWARVLDGKLAPWEERAVASGSREIIGWSARPDDLFYLQGRFPVPSGPAFSGSMEIWYAPVASVRDFATVTGAPERLGAFPLTIPAR